VTRKRFFVVLIVAALWAGAGEAVPPAAVAASYSTEDLRSILRDVSVEYGVDPNLMEALVRVESAFNPYAVSRKGAMGLMQLMPATARRLDVDDPFDPVQNIRGGVREFSRLVDRYSGNLALALAAYNAGEGAVQRYRGIPPYRETRRYVSMIMEMYTGRPYRVGGIARRGPRVRLLKDGESGEVLITNVGGGSVTALGSSEYRPDGALGGGFGR
jgi:soluble lytic murein transglycosylase-like protein